MPNVKLFGHFAVIVSYASKPEWGLRRVGLVEVDPKFVKTKLTEWGHEPNLRIDARCKGVKKVLFVGRKHCYNTKAGWFCFTREYKKVYAIAQQLEQLWPCHMLSRHYKV